jgi:Domain of unknown function (DUF4124)
MVFRPRMVILAHVEKTMNKLAAIILLLTGLCLDADADVWKWVDALGKTHFVDTMTPIYTWQDEYGKVHYSDKPEHESAVSVELVWHSSGTLADTKPGAAQSGSKRDKAVDPDETVDERLEREMAEAYYCKRAREIYDSYLSAPRLYSTNADGDKVYLSEEEAAATIADTQAKVAELCN